MLRNCTNKVNVVGYLKENTLKIGINDKREEIISGHLVVMVDANTEFKIQYYTNHFKKMKPGDSMPQVNKFFTDLSAITDDKTTSFEKILKSDPKATFESSKELLTKITAFGSLQEYLRYNKDGQFAPIVTIKGIGARPSNIDTFNPKAEFEIEVYIDAKKREIKDEQETGRVLITGLFPEYDGSVSEIPFVADTESVEGTNIADYVDSNYNVGDTVMLMGDLVSVSKKTLVKKGEQTFGRKSEDVYALEFINERKIMGGSPAPYEEDDKILKKEDIIAARVVRDEKINKLDKNGQKNAATTKKFSF